MAKTPIVKKENEIVQQPVAQTEVKKELTTIEKVKILGDLANASQNEEVVKVIKELPNGDHIYNLFVSAIEQELNKIMGLSKQDEKSELLNTITVFREFQQVFQEFTSNMKALHNAKLMAVLNILNGKVKGAPQQKNNAPDFILPSENNQFIPMVSQEPSIESALDRESAINALNL